MADRADKIRDERWLRDGEAILSWRDGAVVCRDGLRARSAVVCTDDRVCACDTRTTLPYDQLELGHITAAEYFAPNSLLVLSSGDAKRLLVRTSVEAARATVAAAAQHIPLTLAVHAEHVAAHEAGALLVALPSPAAAAAACAEAAAELPRVYAAAAGPPPPPTLAFVCGKTVACPPDVALGGSAEERELAQTLDDAEVRLADLSAWGRGRGLLATRAYAPGDVVWTEEPLVSWQSGEEMEVAEEVFQAESKRVARLVGLLQAHEAGPVVVPDETPAGGKPPGEWYRRWAEVLQANCWGYTPFEEDCRALLLLGSLVNHSCLPNVRYDTKDGRAAAVFRAVAPIQPGDELTATYTQMLPTLQRQEELRKDRRFTCTCEKCVGPDAARSIACPAESCRGAVVPRSAADGDSAGWLCGACGGCFGAAAMASAVKAETWVSLLAATHAAVELTDVSAHLAAALVFAARHLGARHWTVVFLAEHTLCVDTQGDFSADACELLVRLVLNWTREVDPAALRVRPTVAQALGNAVGKLQASATSSVAIISLARVLAPAFETLRGAADADARGMRTVSELSPGAVDALAGVDWHGFRGGAGVPDDSPAFRTLVSSGADFAGRVTDRLRVLEDAFARGVDAYEDSCSSHTTTSTTMRTLSAVLLAAVYPSMVAGHGYVSAPWGRPYGCKLGHNTGCGNVQFEPQSVEGPDRYPETGVADGEIAAAGNPAWAQLSQTGADRWAKHNLASGWNTFEWTFSATHSTRDFRYWITKEGWNPEEPLSRAQFEEGPFCTVTLDGAQGATNPSHSCFVPQRTGYHVILSVWDVLDTPLGFYNVIDATFGAGTPTPTDAPAPTTVSPPTPMPPVTPPPTGNPWYPRWATSTCVNDGMHSSPQDDWGLKPTKSECCQMHFDWRQSLCEAE